MRIGIDISQIVHEGTGVATYTRNLVSALVNLESGHTFTLFGASLRKRFLFDQFAQKLNQSQSVRTCFLNLPPTFMEYLWNGLHHVKVEKLIGPVDIFHSSDWTQAPSKAKKVTTVHDLVVMKYPDSSHPKIVAAQMRRLAWVKKESDRIIAVSKATKKDILENLNIPEEKIRVVYEAVAKDFESFRSLPVRRKRAEISKIKEKYRLNQDYILALGYLEPRKNLARLVNAFLRQNLPGVELVISGRFGWGKHIEIGENIKTLGFTPQEDLPALYAGARVFVYPSIYEGFGLPVLESFAAGCPVITSSISSLPEVGGGAAFYINPKSEEGIGQTITRVLHLSPSARGRAVETGYQQLSRFSWEKAARETLKVYEELA